MAITSLHLERNTMSKPTILGGRPLHATPIPFVRPILPSLNALKNQFAEILENGMVTTGPYAEQLGQKAADYLGVKHAITVSSCTNGLIISFQTLGLPPGSEVILPSFTFIASGLGPVWNQLRLRFVDVDLNTMNLNPKQVEDAITENTSAILGVHQFGNPAPITPLQSIAEKYQLALLFDSAHGMGTLHHGKPMGGHGKLEVFSLSPTKLMIAAEGGIVTTNDDQLAELISIGRNYGNPGNYNCLFPGMNARMSEFHAIVGLHSLPMLEEATVHRNKMVRAYQEQLCQIAGISFQQVESHDRSSYKDFTIVINEEEFGLNQQQISRALLEDSIQTKVYYAPILHQMPAFQPHAIPVKDEELPNSKYLMEHALSLPLYSNMKQEEVDMVCESLKRIHLHSKEISNILS